MGLACSQSTLLYLTRCKANYEFNRSMNNIKKMSLARDMSELSKEYNRRLNAKHITYYDNGKYNPVNYQYLMGYGENYGAILGICELPLKENNSMVLTDYLGRVILNDPYANAITSVLGASILDSNGSGNTFSASEIPNILAKLLVGSGIKADTFEHVLNGGIVDANYNAINVNTLSGEETGDTTVVDSSEKATEKIQKIIDFYYPIFVSAAANGWTTEYNEQMAENKYYIDDAITSGLFQLASVTNTGQYEEGVSMTYFFVNGDLDQRSDADKREEVTIWYNDIKSTITEKELAIDLDTEQLSLQIEAINTQIESVEQMLKDGLKAFEWKGTA